MRVLDAEITGSASLAENRQVFDRSAGSARARRRSRSHSTENQFIRLEIRSDTLSSLIQNRAIMIEDLCGLDRKTKYYLQKVLLETLLR
ncbi:MAG: hypothetical protein P8L39_12200 [Halioglobus sp.]|nr:hypothetical protein [Halioglobus sp.]